MLEKHTKVFLDANVVIQAGKPPGGPILARLKDLVDAGFITVLTTDLTCQEVAKKHADNDYRVIKDVSRPHFRKLVEEVMDTKLPDVTKKDLETKCIKIHKQSTDMMFKELKSKILKIDNVSPSTVFSAYANREGFFTHEGKKAQFPDAFIFECLKIEATMNEPVIVVSGDGDFVKPIESENYISLVKSLPDLFEVFGLKVDEPDVKAFFERRQVDLIKALDDELDHWGLVGDIEDSEIEETIVTEVEAMDLVSFGSTEEGGPILVIGQLSVKANVSYTHPNWEEAMYDSEDKRLIAFEDVSGETEVSFDVDVSMSLAVNGDGNPKEIERLNFRSSNFQYVDLHSYDPHCWR